MIYLPWWQRLALLIHLRASFWRSSIEQYSPWHYEHSSLPCSQLELELEPAPYNDFHCSVTSHWNETVINQCSYKVYVCNGTAYLHVFPRCLLCPARWNTGGALCFRLGPLLVCILPSFCPCVLLSFRPSICALGFQKFSPTLLAPSTSYLVYMTS